MYKRQTLDYVQALYEKKLTTYPRTDSCYITDDDEEMLAELTDELKEFLGIAEDVTDSTVSRTRRTVNREKVTDHHAILPTRSMLQADLEALPKGEQTVLKLIIARTLMAVSKPFRYLETLLTTECAGEVFTAKGKEILEEDVYKRQPYVWGGSTPETGLDCSGYVCWVYNQNGYDVGRTTANGLWNKSQHISEAEAKPGDLVFFEGTYDTPGKSHVGIYLGNGMMVSAGDPIKYANIHSSYWQKYLSGFGRLSK